MLTKLCKTCNTEKSVTEFNKGPARSPDALNYYCKSCANAMARKNYQENKERYKANAKKRDEEMFKLLFELKNKPCMDCGVKYPPYVMDFDHRDPSEKEFNVCMMRRRRMAFSKIVAEAAKCDVVCSNCHRLRTNARNPSNYTRLELYGDF